MNARSWKLNISFILSASLVLLLAEVGHSQRAEIAKYPSRPITFIIPAMPGSGPDLVNRLLTKEAGKFLGQPLVVLNKPGGNHVIATAAIVTTKADGYTIGYTTNLGLFLAPLMEKVSYHPLKDLRQIMQFGSQNLAVTVRADSPFKRIEDVIAYARQNPKKLTYGSGGIATLGNIIMQQIAKKEKVEFTSIPFKGSAETEMALLGGHILVGTGAFNYSLVDDGQIRVLFLIDEKRSTYYPETPILTDLGYDIVCSMPMTIAAPRDIRDEIARKLEDAFTRAIKNPAFIKGMADLRYTIVYRSSKEAQEYVSSSYDAYTKLYREIGLAK